MASELKQDGDTASAVISSLNRFALTLYDWVVVSYLAGIPVSHEKDAIRTLWRSGGDDIRSRHLLAEVVLPLEALQGHLIAPLA